MLRVIIFAFLFLAVGCKENAVQSGNSEKHKHESHELESVQSWYTCPMHPQIKQENAGQCPICNMNLIEVKASEDFDVSEQTEEETWQCINYPDVTSLVQDVCPIDGTQMIKLKKEDSSGEIVAKIKLRKEQVHHFKAERFSVQPMKMKKNLRLLGKIVQSEERESNIPARIAGRIEKVYISSTGSYVSKGDPVVDIYSPELITTGEEYLYSKRDYQKTKSQQNKHLIELTEEKLHLWGIQKKQIESWSKNNLVPKNTTLYSPVSGIVRTRRVVAGKYVKEGQILYDLVDLSKVWVEIDVYEHDSA